MKPKRLFLLVLLFTVICAAVLDAQGALTLEQARACALANSRTLRKALLSVDSALLAEKLRGYAFLPSISANTGATISYPATTSSGTSSAPTTFANALQGTIGISLSQTIYNGGKSSVLSEIDALATGIARKEARNEYFSVLKNVDAAFFGVGEAQASVEAAQKDLEAARSHLSLAEAKLQANMIALYAYLQAQATEAAKETALIQSEGKLSVADATLASLTGVAAQQTPCRYRFRGQRKSHPSDVRIYRSANGKADRCCSSLCSGKQPVLVRGRSRQQEGKKSYRRGGSGLPAHSERQFFSRSIRRRHTRLCRGWIYFPECLDLPGFLDNQCKRRKQQGCRPPSGS